MNAENDVRQLQTEIATVEGKLAEIQVYYKTYLAEHDWISKSFAELGPEMQELSDLYSKALRLHAEGIINDQQFDKIRGHIEALEVAGNPILELINSIDAKGLQLLKEEWKLIESIGRKKIMVKSIIDFQNESEDSSPIC